jgi:DNA-directed RNA polymerase subunit RPC12/RpoP
MKDVRIDQAQELRCWNCGSKQFTEQRTLRSKVAFGVGALLTKRKLKCVICGEYNDTGSAKPYNGPESRKYRKAYEAELAAAKASPAPPAAKSAAEQIRELGDLLEQGLITQEQFEEQRDRLLGQG